MPVLKHVGKWKASVVRSIKHLQKEVKPDCCVIIGENRIPVHKSILQLNSSMLTTGDVEYNASSDTLEIEIEPEFYDKPDLVKAIIESFYCGKFDFKESFGLKEVYKFCKMYSVKWLQDEFKALIIDYVNGKSDPEELEEEELEELKEEEKTVSSKSEDPAHRFIEIFSFAHSICCDELAEACLGADFLSNKSVEKLLNAELHLDLPVNCVKTLTKSSNIPFDEANLYRLVKSWVNHNAKGRLCFIKDLLFELQFHLIYNNDQNYIFLDVMDFIVKTKGMETRTAIMDHLKDSCMDESKIKDLRCYGRQMDVTSNSVFQNIVSGEKVENEHLTELFNEDCHFLRTKDVLLLVKSLLENHWSDDWMKENSRVILDSIDCNSTLSALYTCSLLLDSFVKFPENIYKIDWKDVPYETVLFIGNLQTIKEDMNVEDDMGAWRNDRIFYLESISSPFEHRLLLEIVMLWSLAHPESKENIQSLLDLFCFETIPKKYINIILLPTVKYLLPDVHELECVHESDCGSYYCELRDGTINKENADKIVSVQGKSGSSGLKWDRNNDVCYPIELLEGNLIIKQNYKLRYYLKQVFFLIFDDRKPFEPVYPCFSLSKNIDHDVSITKLNVLDSNRSVDEFKRTRFMFIHETN